MQGGTGLAAALDNVCRSEYSHPYPFSIDFSPEVDFVSYSMPHPSEPKTNVRIQTTEKTTAIEAVTKGLANVQGICSHIIQTFNTELMKGEFEYEDDDEDK